MIGILICIIAVLVWILALMAWILYKVGEDLCQGGCHGDCTRYCKGDKDEQEGDNYDAPEDGAGPEGL